MAVKNKKYRTVYGEVFYVLSVVATMSLYFSDAEESKCYSLGVE